MQSGTSAPTAAPPQVSHADAILIMDGRIAAISSLPSVLETAGCVLLAGGSKPSNTLSTLLAAALGRGAVTKDEIRCCNLLEIKSATGSAPSGPQLGGGLLRPTDVSCASTTKIKLVDLQGRFVMPVSLAQ